VLELKEVSVALELEEVSVLDKEEVSVLEENISVLE
jgi:hypothetical protein